MSALRTRTMPSLRMLALTALAAATLGLAAVPPAAYAATTTDLPTRKQVCYQDPGKGKVCQWVWEWPGVILPKTN